VKPIQELKDKVTNGIKEKVQSTIEENVNKVAEQATQKTIEKMGGTQGASAKDSRQIKEAAAQAVKEQMAERANDI